MICMCGHPSGNHGGDGCLVQIPDGKGGTVQCSCHGFCARDDD